MYGALNAMLRSVGVRNWPRCESTCARPVSLPVLVLSLYAPDVLNGLARRAGTSWCRPRSVAGTFGPVCGTPSAWNAPSESVGPEWHFTQPAVPMKRRRPFFADADSAE